MSGIEGGEDDGRKGVGGRGGDDGWEPDQYHGDDPLTYLELVFEDTLGLIQSVLHQVLSAGDGRLTNVPHSTPSHPHTVRLVAVPFEKLDDVELVVVLRDVGLSSCDHEEYTNGLEIPGSTWRPTRRPPLRRCERIRPRGTHDQWPTRIRWSNHPS